MIEFSQVNKSFSGVPLLREVSFKVSLGERVSLIGPGGCGKTTLLKILLGLVPPDAGTALLMSQQMQEEAEQEGEKRRQQILRRVGMAFQQGGLFDFMTVRENLLFAMSHMTSLSPELMEQRVKDLLAGVRLPHTTNQFPYELSGGMKRRVGIARALCTDPVIALFDEPTSGLDPVTSTIILNMIQDLAGKSGEQKTLLISTTNVEIAMRFAERMIVLNDGVIMADGLWKDLLLTGPEWVRHFLGMRLIGLSLNYVRELGLPDAFIAKHWA